MTHRTLPILLVLVGTPLAVADEAASLTEEWSIIRLGDARVGYGHVKRWTAKLKGKPIVVTEDVSQLTIKRFGQELVMRVELTTAESPDGELIEMRTTTRNPPADPDLTRAVVDGDRLKLETETAGNKTTRTLAWKAGTKSPTWSPLEKRKWKPGDERTVSAFLPMLNRTVDVTTKAVRREMVTLQDGTKRELLRVVTSDGLNPETVSFHDAEGRELLSRVEMLGTVMSVEVVPRKVALAKIEAAEVDLGIRTLIRVDRIPNAHRSTRAVYKVRAAGDDPGRYVAEGGTQSIRRIDDEAIEVTVHRAVFGKPVNREAGAEYLASSRFLQTRDERVVAHAEAAIEKVDANDTVAVVRAMERYVHDELKDKNFSTAIASAAEVAERMEGDCTEHAVLLAAMLRSRKVPARIAVGFVYAASESAFAGHMWTEAFVDGHWIPIDGTLGRGGTAAAHLKLADSAFGDDDGHPIAAFLPVLECIGKLEIEVVEVE